MRIVVVGALASNPDAGTAWMHVQIAAGLLRLGHDAYYMEATSTWPYDPERGTRVSDAGYAVPYLTRIAGSFGLGDRWAYRRSYDDRAWIGMTRARAEGLLAEADLVLNVAGATRFGVEGLEAGRLVLLGTDPAFFELALDLALPKTIVVGRGEAVRVGGVPAADRELFEEHGWALCDATAFTRDPWPYREYIRSSAGELSIARDVDVRLRSGRFSERSACYLAAGRPVVAQDTGFGEALPTGEGLLAFTTAEEALAGLEEVDADYERHSRAAREIAEEHFRAETVLARLLADLGL